MYNTQLNIEYNVDPVIGMFNKYYYVYKIELQDTNEYYYGVHSTKKLDDGYGGSGYLLTKRYNQYSIDKFKKIIIKFFDTIDDAYIYEHDIVNIEMLQDKYCLNLVVGGRRYDSNKGKKAMHNFVKTIYVYEDEINLYNSLGWVKGRNIDISRENNPAYNRVWLNNGVKNFYVYKDDAEYYINMGCVKGMIRVKKNSNNIYWINNGQINKRVLKVELDTFLKNGWTIGRINYKRNTEKYNKNFNILRWINNGIKNKRISSDKVNEYISNGWVEGRTSLKRIKPSSPCKYWINKDNINKRVLYDEIQEYINKGWKRGKYIKSYKNNVKRNK